jgi:hypothetical protein
LDADHPENGVLIPRRNTSRRSGGIAPDTVTNLEIGRYAGDPETLAIIEQMLMKAGIDFIEENGGGPGVRLRRPPQGKQRK